MAQPETVDVSRENNEPQVKVLFFAKSREIVGKKETVLPFNTSTTSKEILDTLIEKFSGLSILRENLVLSLNEEYVEINEEIVHIKPGDELALIPPISGG